jgi:hypothetical protein
MRLTFIVSSVKGKKGNRETGKQASDFMGSGFGMIMPTTGWRGCGQKGLKLDNRRTYVRIRKITDFAYQKNNVYCIQHFYDSSDPIRSGTTALFPPLQEAMSALQEALSALQEALSTFRSRPAERETGSQPH